MNTNKKGKQKHDNKVGKRCINKFANIDFHEFINNDTFERDFKKEITENLFDLADEYFIAALVYTNTSTKDIIESFSKLKSSRDKKKFIKKNIDNFFTGHTVESASGTSPLAARKK